MYVLNNVTTTDDYSAANTLDCPEAVKLDIQVYNAAIFYKYAVNPGGGVSSRGIPFQPEVFLAPGIYLLVRRAVTVAVRSAAAGAPAQVTIEALTSQD